MGTHTVYIWKPLVEQCFSDTEVILGWDARVKAGGDDPGRFVDSHGTHRMTQHLADNIKKMDHATSVKNYIYYIWKQLITI